MDVLIKIAQFLLSLSFLIVIHEMGHYFFARLFKTRVEKFYLFFDAWFSLFKFKRGDCEYGIGWIPLGGYVKISGMIDESMDTEQMKQPPQPWEFRSKPAWQRLLIMTGGVLVNFFAALVIYAMILYTWGEQQLPTRNVKYGITTDSIAKTFGFQNGDQIVSIDNQEVKYFNDVVPQMLINEAKTVQVIRDSQKIDINLPEGFVNKLIRSKKAEFMGIRFPFYIGGFVKGSEAEKAGLLEGDRIVGIDTISTPFFDQFKSEIVNHKNDSVLLHYIRNDQKLSTLVKVSEIGTIGVSAGSLENEFEFEVVEYTFWQSLPAGVSKGYEMLVSYIQQFKLIFSPTAKGYESLGGFITIGNIFPGTWHWESFWSLTAFLSVILAFMNILPIPALDGGHVLFLLYELVSGRKPSDKFLEYAQITGMVIIFGLIIYANLNDIIRFFF